MPISLIDENMDRAHNRDGLLYTKFWWKTNNIKSSNFTSNTLKSEQYLRSQTSGSSSSFPSDQFSELLISEILAGKPEIGYVGVLPLVEKFMEV